MFSQERVRYLFAPQRLHHNSQDALFDKKEFLTSPGRTGQKFAFDDGRGLPGGNNLRVVSGRNRAEFCKRRDEGSGYEKVVVSRLLMGCLPN